MPEREIKVLTTRLPLEEFTALREYAHAEKRSMNEVLAEALRHYLVERVVDPAFQAKIKAAREEARLAFERLRAE